jgi:hypothetical protein
MMTGVRLIGDQYMKRTCLALTIAALCGSPAFAESLVLTQPNGGEQMCLGQTYQIKWTAVGVTGDVKLVLFKGGFTVGKIGEAPAVAGVYNWIVAQSAGGPGVPGNDYTIRVVTMAGTTSDFSNGNFTIKSAGTCGGGPTPTPTATPTPTPGGGGGTIDPGLLEKLKHYRVIEVKWPIPGPNPCLSCPSFDLGSLLDLVGHPNETLILRLLKNGQPIVELGSLGKGRTLARTVTPRLSAPDFALLKTRGAQFEVGVFSANGMLQHKIAIQAPMAAR